MIHKQRLNNRILSLVLALVMVLSMLPLSAVPAHAAANGPCTGDHSGWTAISSAKTITAPGKYYVSQDYTHRQAAGGYAIWINGDFTGEVVICLNGKTVATAARSNQWTSVIYVNTKNASVSLCDCIGTGKITMGESNYGYPTGINVNAGTLNMYGGTITGVNRSAVHIVGSSRFNMYGGSITGNSRGYLSNGCVDLRSGTFNMYGGSISENENAGVYFSDGTMSVSGSAKISGNSNGNLYLKAGKTVTVGELTDGAEIYVTSANTGSHIAITGTNAADYSKYFHADDSSYQILNKDNVIYLHKHSYSAANCVAPATCACGLTEGNKDSTNHNISTEWITENGKHYKECLNGCGTKFEEGACSGGTATCITPEICEVCGIPYGEALGHDFVDGICSRCGISKEGVYHIFTAEQLVSFATLVNAGDKSANAILMADIDMAGYDWTPICQTDSYHTSGSTVTDAGYAGTFDGNGHVISNLTVKGGDSGIKSYGLFGTLSGTVKRLGLDNYSFNVGSADCRAGGIAGQVVSGGLITDCYVINSEVLTGSRIAGGIAGCNYGGTIQNCFVQNTEVTGSSDRFGWISGDCQDDGGNKPGTVINCYTDGTRVVSSRSSNATIKDCAVVTDEQFATGEITYKLNGSTSEGELVWKQTIGTHEHPVFDGGTVYKVSCETVELYSNENRNYETHNFVKGICSRCGELMPAVNNNGIYEIHNVGQLIWFAEYVNAGNTTASAKLMADIDLNGHGNVMIGTFSAKYSGTFDGNGKKLTVSFDSTEQYIAPFRYINGATIRDLTVDGTIATSQKFAAGLIGYSEGNSKIEKCMVSVTINSTVSGDGTHGGLVANVSAGSMTIDNCGFIGSITGNGTHSCGGFVGWANSTTTISNSYVSGTFTTGTNNCYTFGRNAEKISVSNSYYKTAYGTNNSGATQKSADQFASGEVTYLLNGSTSEGDLVWYQTLETDAYPQFTGSVVYYDSVNGYNNHIHNWTYTKDGNKITATCNATGCTNPDGGSVTIAEPENLTYNGKTKDATLSYTGWQPEVTPTITYSGADDRENVTGKDITASITLGNAKAEVTYRVEAATITGATVTVEENQYVYDGTAKKPTVTVTMTITTTGSNSGSSSGNTGAGGIVGSIGGGNISNEYGSSGDVNIDNESNSGQISDYYIISLTENVDYTITYANNVNAGTATVTVTGIGNYSGEIVNTFTISPRETTVTAPENKALDMIPSEVDDVIALLPTTVTTTDGLFKITWSCSNLNTVPNGASTFAWSITDEKWSNYTADVTSGTITVTNGNAIAVNHTGTNQKITYNGSTYDVAYMFTIDENAGGKYYDIVGGTGAGTLNGSVLTVTKAGTIEIKLTTAANGAYAAGDATATLTVNKGAGSGTVTIEGWTYGEDAKTPVVNSSTNGIASVIYLYESTDGKGYTGSVAPENAGSYKLTVTFAATDLYEACTDDATFTVEQKKITASITGSVSKVYDGTNTVPNGHGLSIALSEIGTDDVTATASFAYDGVNVGTTKVGATGITLSGADAGNYKLTATTASANVGTITQATPAYTVPTGLTATYGDMLADVTLPEGFAWEAALTTAVGDVGDREFAVTYTPGDTLNYKTVTGIEVSIEVKAAAASVATAPTAISGLIYNKTAQALIAAGTANGGELQYSLSRDSGYSTTIPTGTGAGTYTVWYKVVGDSNHSDTAPVSIEIKIGKADPALGAVTAGVVNDTLDISAIALNRANTSVNGVLTVDAGQELKLGDNEIAYTFTPADTDNYERVTGKVTVTVKDTIAPTGKVTLGANSWNEFLNNITVALFFRETQTVSVEASDSFSGVEKIEYYAASDVLDLDGVKALADDKWTVMDGSVNVTAEDAKQFIYYIRITDKSGNIGYLATNGAEFDTTAPVIDGVHNGVTYYTTQKITVTDKNLDTVTLNGEPVTGTVTLDGNKEATYTIVATDKAGNTTTVTVTMKLTESVGAPLDGITQDNVTSEDKETIQDVIVRVEDLLSDEDLTEEEKATLEEIKGEAEKLIGKIEEVTGATDTENTEKVEDITPENVKPEDKTDLEKAKEDLEDALENNGDNYTEDEKKAIQEEIDRIDEALEVIDRVEKVEQQIENLPDTITKSDEAAVKAAEEVYNALTDYEKSLVSNDSKKALDDAVAALAELNKPQTPPTGDSFNFGLWTSIMVVSAIALAVLLIEQKKRKMSK